MISVYADIWGPICSICITVLFINNHRVFGEGLQVSTYKRSTIVIYWNKGNAHHRSIRNIIKSVCLCVRSCAQRVVLLHPVAIALRRISVSRNVSTKNACELVRTKKQAESAGWLLYGRCKPRPTFPAIFPGVYRGPVWSGCRLRQSLRLTGCASDTAVFYDRKLQ